MDANNINNGSIIQVAAGIIWKQDKFLLTKRPAGSHLGGLWEFPGGKIKTGENPADALIREVKEEIGINIEVKYEFIRVYHEYPEKNVELIVFQAKLEDGDPQLIEIADFRWISPGEIGNFELPDADKKIFKESWDKPQK